jgi:hypothetical protein
LGKETQSKQFDSAKKAAITMAQPGNVMFPMGADAIHSKNHQWLDQKVSSIGGFSF